VTRRRLDAELVRRGLCTGRAAAREAIESGAVQVAGTVVTKPASMVADDEPLVVLAPSRPFVSRAGGKLAAALDRFALDPAGLRCLDAGASTGGFTDVLLQRGAARVVAVDVGYGQLAWSIRSDPRVDVWERTNIRTLDATAIGGPVDLVVADLSFISLRTVLPAMRDLAIPDAPFVVLVKPQFEVGKERVGKGGVVRDPEAWRGALDDVATAAGEIGLVAVDAIASPLPGPAGNVEFLLLLRAGTGQIARADLGRAVAEGETVRA
jgi:23S rRNA (cytidine1920-2'-O)/16S rRNA (cytidine1409-2'-O)-methyltransferase